MQVLSGLSQPTGPARNELVMMDDSMKGLAVRSRRQI
jgi:hypothetical protein